MKNKSSFLVINYTEDISGSSVSLLRLLDALSGGVEFTLITSPGSYAARIAKEKKWNCLEAEIPLMDIRNLWFYWLIYLKRVVRLGILIRRFCVKHKPDTILINSALNLGWIPGWLITPAPFKSQVFWLIHELDVKPRWFFHKIIRIVELIACKIICVSSPVQSLFKRKTFLLPNITLPALIENPKNPLALGEIKFLWTGTLIPRKGPHKLAKILSGLSSLGKQISLEMVVSLRPRYRDYLKTCVRDLKFSGIEPYVYENIDDPLGFYSSEKILLQTSEFPESFSLTPLEAMSRGMLVFASSQGGIIDYGKHDENLFFWENLEGTLGDKIEELSGDPGKILNIQLNALKTSQEYSPEKIAARFTRIGPNAPK